MLSFVFILSFLSFATAFKAIHFSSIQQCGSFNVTFSGPQPAAPPLTLTVVPFGSSAVPLSIPLPNPKWDSVTSTGVAITFLPYPAETTFVASLSDAQGRSMGFASDIIRILQSNNASCVSAVEQTQIYTPEPPFSQCQPFNVTFDPTKATPPAVRLFVPNGQAFLLNQTQESTDPGTSGFTMVAFRGQSAILLFRDGLGQLQSTNLLTVAGDVTSSNSCFPDLPDDVGSKKNQQTGLSRQAVIGIVASIASVVTLLCVLVVVHFLRRRVWNGRNRKTMQHKGIEGGPGLTEPETTPPPDLEPAQSPWNTITIINKPVPYPMEKYTSRPISPYLAQPTPGYCGPGRQQQIQSLNAATADLDQILNASIFASGGNRTWSSLFLPSSPPSRDARYTGSSVGTKELPKATIPVSPLSSTSNFRDSIIPGSYIRAGIPETDPDTEDWVESNTARRSSTTVIISGQEVLY